MDIVTVGDEGFVLGFEVAGIKHSYRTDKGKDANNVFEDLLRNSDIGIAITEKKTFDMLSERMKERVMTSVKPTFVVLSFDVGAEENLKMMIKRSLGVDLW